MIQNLLLVGCGSFVGGALRYLCGQLLAGHTLMHFAIGTMSVNLAGCFLFGLIYGLLERFGALQSQWALVLTVGLCGGFTTFSTFSSEALNLLRSGAIAPLLAYVLTSVVGGILLLYAGRQITTTL
ncbi:MAG: fluoride efflux transporter CrcB [Bacteroidales bacterium]|nr:fluoride efflux transporter CrcB [Bacteroidales bacterium]